MTHERVSMYFLISVPNVASRGRLWSLFLFGILSCSVAWGGKYNEVLSIGDVAPAWTDLPGTDDQSHSRKSLDKFDVLVVAFTCNSCPYAVDYEERMIALAKKYSGQESRVGVVAINVNKIEADSLPKMKKRASDRGFNFPYLFDESQEIAKAFGAQRTPEFFVLDRSRKVVYMGAMDDNTKEAEVKVRYVADAIEATLQSKPVSTAETPPVGCAIRFAKQRK